jgi:hypothetical protein
MSSMLVRITHTHSIVSPIPSIIHISFVMENEYFSDSQFGESEPSKVHHGDTIPVGFTITHQDSGILQEYLDDFRVADTDLRTRIIEKVMAELYLLRPSNTPFDKNEASNVCGIYESVITLLIVALENTEMVLQPLHSP